MQCCQQPPARASFQAISVYYSESSEEGTLWDRSLCPLFRGCPFLGSWSLFSVSSHNWNSGNLQHPTAEGVSCLEIHSYVRGYHAYKKVWEHARGEDGTILGRSAYWDSQTGSNKSSGQARSWNLQRRYYCRLCLLQRGSQTVAIWMQQSLRRNNGVEGQQRSWPG